MTCNNLTLFLETDGIEIDGKLWNMQENRSRAGVWRCTVCFCCCVCSYGAPRNFLSACDLQNPFAKAPFGRWSLEFLLLDSSSYACTLTQAYKQTQQTLVRAKPFTNMLLFFRPETVAKWTRILPDTHATAHTSTHTQIFI